MSSILSNLLGDVPLPTVLIGPISDDPAESVSAVNRALSNGMAGRYKFIHSFCNRKHGETKQSQINPWNLYYLIKHTSVWLSNLYRKRPDVAHYAVSSGIAMEKGLLFLAIARFLGCATVGHLHSGGFLDHWKRLPTWRARFALRQLRKLDCFIVLSNHWREQVVTIVGLEPGKVFVVNNPIDSELEQRALTWPVGRGDLSFLSLGALETAKGVLDLVAASAVVAKEHSFKVHIVGPEREPRILERIKQSVEDLDISTRVELRGPVFGEEKFSLFHENSVFILPSHYENFPLVILEAAAAGLAIIATPVGALPEFFEHGESALFVSIGDVAGLAAAMELLVKDKDLRLRLGIGARRVFRERLGLRGIVTSLDAAYSHSLQRNRSIIA